MQVSSPTPKVATRESALPQCAQLRLVKLKMAVDDAEAARADIHKRIAALRPDETLERSALDLKRVANDKALSYARSLLGRVDQWIQASGALHHVVPTKLVAAPRTGDVKPEWGKIENCRRKISHLKQELLDVRRAPLPFAQIEAALKSTVATWASEGSPNIKIDDVRGHVDVTFGINVPKPHKIAAWLDPAAMHTRLVAQARKQFESKREPMTPEQKAERIKDLREALYQTELHEVAMIDAFIDAGEKDVIHRLDVDPAALLGVREPKGLMRTELVA